MLKYVIPLVLFWSFSSKSVSDGYIYKPKEYTKQQKIWQGKIKQKKYTTCRLKKIVKSQITGQQACIYQGGNKTFEMMIERNCPKQYKCIYNPNGEEPDIDKVMKILRSIAKCQIRNQMLIKYLIQNH